MTQWTLVQHSGYVTGAKAEFRRAVELHALTPREAARVEKAKGPLYDTWNDANNAEYAANYPPGTPGLLPNAKGKFGPFES